MAKVTAVSVGTTKVAAALLLLRIVEPQEIARSSV